MHTLTELFVTSIRQHFDKPALCMRPRWRTITWTFGELGGYAQMMSELLQSHGVGYGDRVVLLSHNMIAWPGSFFGILLRGAIVIPLNPQNTLATQNSILAQTQPKLILKASHISYTYEAIPTVHIDTVYDPIGAPQIPSAVESAPDDIAEIVYTSGTTGDPKGVVLTHGNIVSNVTAIAEKFSPEPKDKVVSVLPLFHMFEQTAGLFAPLSCGIEIMYAPALNSRSIAHAMQHMRVTKMVMVPEMLETILARIERLAEEAGRKRILDALFSLATYCPFWLRRWLFCSLHKRFGGRLKFIVSGGAPLLPATERKWRLMGVQILQGYGLTETSPVVSTNSETAYRLGSVGKPVSCVEVTIAADGEILVAGSSVFSHYYNNPAQTRAAFDAKGRYKTGDLGYFDEDGFLFIHGRKKYVIVSSSGENIYPEDIERVLKKDPVIVDAAVIGLSQRQKEIVYAVLLGNIEAPQQHIDYANAQLASYQRIQDYAVWPEADFPRSATRKVQKEKVKEWLEARTASQERSPSSSEDATPLVKLLAQIAAQPVEVISNETYLGKHLHLDSLMRIELSGAIEEQFDVILDEHDIRPEMTVAMLQEAIEAQKKRPVKKSMRHLLVSFPVCILRTIVQYLVPMPLYGLWIKVMSVGLPDRLNTPVIFMANHVSYVDAWLIYKALPLRIRFSMATAAAVDFMYEHFWWIAWFVELGMNTYRFPRTEHENIKPGLETTGMLLDHGFSILIFPEGKIFHGHGVGELKLGAGLLATEMRVPVVPVFIDGITDCLKPEKLLPYRRGEVQVRFGKPLTFSLSDSYVQATETIHNAINDLAEKP